MEQWDIEDREDNHKIILVIEMWGNQGQYQEMTYRIWKKKEMNNKYSREEDIARLNNVRIFVGDKEKESFKVNLKPFYLRH